MFVNRSMIYGTDFPYNDWKLIQKDIERVKNLNLTESAMEKSGDNIGECVGIVL